jgi:hypothetical protein
MGLFSKVKKSFEKVTDPFGIVHKDKKKKAAPVDPDPINPLTGLRRSQDGPQDPFSQPVGLGQMPSIAPPPVAADQRIPQGLGSNVFRSTLAPLQQQGYGLGQIDPRLLTSTVRFPGGSPVAPPQMQMAAPPMQQQDQLQRLQQFGLGRLPRMFL